MNTELPTTLFPSKVKPLLLCLGSLAICIVCVLIYREEPIAGAIGIVLSGVVGLVGAIQLLPGSSYLRLTDEGMTFRSLFRSFSYKWWEIADFGIARVGGSRVVGWNFSRFYQGQERLRTVNQALSGFQAALPDSYGMQVDSLKELLNTLRDRHGSPRPA